VHTSSDHHLIRPTVLQHIPTTDLARTVLDLAGVLQPAALDEVVDQIINRRGDAWDDVLATYVRHARRGRPGIEAIRGQLDRRAGATRAPESPLERRFLSLLRAAGLPEPQPQVDIFDGDELVMRADFGFRDFRLGYELDSVQHHLNTAAFQADRRKRNRARRLGWLIPEYTHEMLVSTPTAVCEDYLGSLISRGYPVDGRLR